MGADINGYITLWNAWLYLISKDGPSDATEFLKQKGEEVRNEIQFEASLSEKDRAYKDALRIVDAPGERID